MLRNFPQGDVQSLRPTPTTTTTLHLNDDRWSFSIIVLRRLIISNNFHDISNLVKQSLTCFIDRSLKTFWISEQIDYPPDEITKMVTGAKDLLPAMGSDGSRVIFDQDLVKLGSNSVSTKSVSRSGSDCSDSGRGSGTRETHRGRRRSSSNSSSTSSLSSSNRPRSRSHPRCHRNSSRCRCATHYRQAHEHRRHRSPPRRARANSRSCSPSLPVRSSRHRSNRPRHSSNSRKRTSPGSEGSDRRRTPKSPSKSHRSRSRSPRRSAASPTLDEKKELLRAVKEDATKILMVDLPESMTPILDEPCEDCPTPEPQAWVRAEAVPEKVPSQNSDVKTDGQRSKVSPIRRIIAFSIHNSIAKPTVAPVTSAKVTPRVDGIESRKPYGHWVPIRQGGRAHKRTTSR